MRADVQGLRAVAVLLVVAFHAGLPVPGGFVGVDVFFVISGFVITKTLLRELEDRGSISFRAFYARRARRLLPGLATMLVVVTLASAVAAPFAALRMTALTSAAASVFSANLYLFRLGTGYFDLTTGLNPLLHTWTLAVEEQFYLVFPLLLALAWRVGRRRLALLTIAGVTAASVELSVVLSAHDGAVGRFAFYGSPTRAWEFGLGALLVFAPRMTSPLLGAIAGVTGAALVDFAATSLHGTIGYPGLAAAYPAVGAVLLIAAGDSATAPVTRILSTRPLTFVGDISYSLYLWHWPLIVFGTALLPGVRGVGPAAAFLAVLPAWLSFRYVESPIRLRLALPRVPAPALTAACVAVPALAAAALVAWHTTLAHEARFISLARAAGLHADVVRGCDSPIPLAERKSPRCTWTSPHSRGTVVLVGDSNAGHFTEPFVAAARRLGYTATVATFSSCPFVPVRVRESGAQGDMARCRSFVDGTLSDLGAERPDVVVVASRTDKYLNSPNFALAAEATGASASGFARSPAAKAATYAEGLTAELRSLAAHGVRVVVVHPVPRMPYDPGGCATGRVLAGACEGRRPLRDVDSELRLAQAAEDRAVAATPAATTLDLAHYLCDRTTCATSHGEIQMYRDEYHLSIDGARTLEPAFAAVLGPPLRRVDGAETTTSRRAGWPLRGRRSSS